MSFSRQNFKKYIRGLSMVTGLGLSIIVSAGDTVSAIGTT